MVELRLLHTFAAVAELRHFARAADRCNLSQPAVSHQIRLLEEQVGARLLNRDRRRVSLTVAGEVFLEETKRILASVDRARERVHGLTAGTIGRVRLGATEAAGLYMLPPLLAQYRAAHPHFALQFTICDEATLLERVVSNDLDMAVAGGEPVLGELRARRLARDVFALVAAPEPVAGGSVKTADLRSACWILDEEGSDSRRQLEAWLRRHRITPAETLVLRGPDAVKRAAAAGLGVALVPKMIVAEELGRGTLREVGFPGRLPAHDVFIIDHPHKHHGAACQAMLRLLGG